MKDKIKLFEEYFWQTSDNEIVNRIINILKKGIDINNLTNLCDGSFGKYHYLIDKKNDNNDIDPFGEEDWGNNISIDVQTSDYWTEPFHYIIYVNKGSEEKIELNTNKGRKIFMMLHKAYKNRKKEIKDKEENDRKEKLKDLFK